LKYSKRHANFHLKLDILFWLALINFQFWLSILLKSQHQVSYLSALNVGIFAFNILAFLYWRNHRIPDKAFNNILYQILILPFFALLSSAIIFFCTLPFVALSLFFEHTQIFITAILIVSIILGIYSSVITPFYPQIKHLNLKINLLPNNFHKYKVIHIGAVENLVYEKIRDKHDKQ
jgi:hypothetical protein